MTVINDRVTDIISLFEEISFQASILAILVEAEVARSEKEIKRFESFASEIYKLMERSAGEAKEITFLINDKESPGPEPTGDTETTMMRIAVVINRVTQIMEEIATT